MNSDDSFELNVNGVERTHALGRAIGAACKGGERIALVGDLGSGKTSFARGLAAGLCIDVSEVSSPTFTILHEHAGGRDGLRFVHADAYRVADIEELDALGWPEILEDGGTVVALEWPDLVPGALPAAHLTVSLAHGENDECRHVTLSVDPRGTHLYPLAKHSCPSCDKRVNPTDSAFPFCSGRCRMADLGKWFAGGYVISREVEEDDLFDPDLG